MYLVFTFGVESEDQAEKIADEIYKLLELCWIDFDAERSSYMITEEDGEILTHTG